MQMSLPKNQSKQKPSAQMLRFPRTANLLPRRRFRRSPDDSTTVTVEEITE
ncbi:MAG: hypothetical protein ACLT76_10040 [Clostridium fessum]